MAKRRSEPPFHSRVQRGAAPGPAATGQTRTGLQRIRTGGVLVCECENLSSDCQQAVLVPASPRPLAGRNQSKCFLWFC